MLGNKKIDNTQNLKKQIMGLIKYYENGIKDLELELEQIEYEPAPSGEMNESMAIMAPLEAEISTLENTICDLEQILKT